MFKDETMGQLKVVESRMEWLAGSISARRSYYTTVISFDNAEARPAETDSSMLEPEKMDPGSRDPHMVHQSGDSSTSAFTLRKCPVSSYYPPAQTYIDLVDDSASLRVDDQRIRIRGGSRRLWTPGELEEQGGAPMARRPRDQDTLGQRIQDLYKNGTDVFWPPQQDPTAHDPTLTDLYTILNPPDYLGNPHGSWDERSLVYATGGMDGGPKALVFVSWDPAIYLAGTSAYSGNPDGGSVAALSVLPQESKGKGGRNITKRHPISQPGATSCPLSEETKPANTESWKALESARYCDISRGYHFAR